jgi:hypothetical protein
MQGLVAEVIAHHRESSNDHGYTRSETSISEGVDVGARTMICESRAGIEKLGSSKIYERPLSGDTAWVYVYIFDWHL